MEEYISHSLSETQKLGSDIAGKLKPGSVIAYKGPMGAGKTTLTRSIVTALGAEDVVSSPTFALMNEYQGRVLIRHFDMYRISDYDSLYSTGFFDYLDSEDSIIIIEWSENIENILPDNAVVIEIKYGNNENERIFKIYPLKEGK